MIKFKKIIFILLNTISILLSLYVIYNLWFVSINLTLKNQNNVLGVTILTFLIFTMIALNIIMILDTLEGF